MSRIGRRLLTAAAGVVVAAGVGLPAVLLTTTAANADVNDVTATTNITNNLASDGGPSGTIDCNNDPSHSSYCWASDNFTRVLTLTQQQDQVCQDDTALAHSYVSGKDICWSASIVDTGTFTTLLNAYQPNQDFSVLTSLNSGNGNRLLNIVKGAFSGTASWTLYAPNFDTLPDATNVLASLNDNLKPDGDQIAQDQTQNWYQQAFSPSEVNDLHADYHGDWSWTYTTGCNESWTDSGVTGAHNNGYDGQSTPLSVDGNITGIVDCTPDVVTVTNPGTQTTAINTAVTLNNSGSATDSDSIVSWTATGLPPGLSIESATGQISGTPNTAGTYTVTVTANDNDESGSTTFSWIVQAAPVVTGTNPPPPSTSTYGDEVNNFGNGFDVFQQHFAYGAKIVGWPATQNDPATHFIRFQLSNGNWTFEAAPFDVGDGLCVSNPGNNLLVLRSCNNSIYQQFTTSGSGSSARVRSAVNGGYVNPNGTGAQLSVGSSPVPWGGSDFVWKDYTSLPV